MKCKRKQAQAKFFFSFRLCMHILIEENNNEKGKKKHAENYLPIKICIHNEFIVLKNLKKNYVISRSINERVRAYSSDSLVESFGWVSVCTCAHHTINYSCTPNQDMGKCAVCRPK